MHVLPLLASLPLLLQSPLTSEPKSDADAIALAEKIEKSVERLRGLAFLRPVKKGVYDKKRLAAFLEEQFKKDGAVQEMAWKADAYKLLGLVPQSMDILKETSDVLLEQIGGFYDPDSQELRVMLGFKGAVGEMLMAHELCHALEDQHFALKSIDDALKAAAPDDDDRVFAAHSVMEGSATNLMTNFMTDAISSGKLKLSDLNLDEMMANPAMSGEKAMAAPPILVRPLMEMYMSGAKFLTRGGMPMGAKRRDVNHGFLQLPMSSEQVLHPDKYWNQEDLDLPQAVTIPDLSEAFGAGWKKLGTNVLGEVGVAILTAPPKEKKDGKPSMEEMQAEMMAPVANDASSGWDGDRYAVYGGPDGRSALVWATVWDKPRDVEEFLGALRLPATSAQSLRVEDQRLFLVVTPQSITADVRSRVLASLAAKTTFAEAKPISVPLPEGSQGRALEKAKKPAPEKASSEK